MNNILGNIEQAISAVIAEQKQTTNRDTWRKLQVVKLKLEQAWDHAYVLDSYTRTEVNNA